MALTWFDLPQEIQLMIIGYALADLNLKWSGRTSVTRTRQAVKEAGSSQFKAIRLVSKRFVDPGEIICIGLKQNVCRYEEPPGFQSKILTGLDEAGNSHAYGEAERWLDHSACHTPFKCQQAVKSFQIPFSND